MSRLIYVRNNQLVAEEGFAGGTCNFVFQPVDSILTRAGFFIPIDPTSVLLTDWLDGGHRLVPLSNHLNMQGTLITPEGRVYVIRRLMPDKEPVFISCEPIYTSKHWMDLGYEYASRRETLLTLLRLNSPRRACELYSQRIHETHHPDWFRITSIRALAAKAKRLGATGEIPEILWLHEKPKSE